MISVKPLKSQNNGETMLIKYMVRQPGEEGWYRYYEEIDQEVWDSPERTAMINTALARKHPGCEIKMYHTMKITTSSVRIILLGFGLVWFFLSAALLMVLHDTGGWGNAPLFLLAIMLMIFGTAGFYLILRYLENV